MATQCYAQVRGSALRVTGLKPCGSLPDAVSYGVSKSVADVRISEVIDPGSNELLRTSSENNEEARLHFVRSDDVIRYTADIKFLRVDPGLLSLMAPITLVYGPDAVIGYGEGGFGEGGFGGYVDPSGTVVGFDSDTRLPAKAFALEVWTKLAGQVCADGSRKYGYTLFPFLKGGVLGGFEFSNGLVSFTLRSAQTRVGSKWGYGPWNLSQSYYPWDVGGWDMGEWAGEADGVERLTSTIKRRVHWRQTIVDLAPPVQTDGVQTFYDVIDNGTAADPGTGVLDGQTAGFTSTDNVSGNGAA